MRVWLKVRLRVPSYSVWLSVWLRIVELRIQNRCSRQLRIVRLRVQRRCRG